MKASDLLLIVSIVSLIVVACLHLSSMHHHGIAYVSWNDGGDHLLELDSLRKLVLLQNDTIHMLELHLDNILRTTGSKVVGHAVAATIAASSSSSPRSQTAVTSHSSTEDCIGGAGARNHSSYTVQYAGSLNGEHPRRERMSALESDCESRYGMGLVREWRKRAQVWCESDQAGKKIKTFDRMYGE